MPLELNVKEEVYYAFKILREPANDVYQKKGLGTSLLLSLFLLIVLYLFVFIFVIE